MLIKLNILGIILLSILSSFKLFAQENFLETYHPYRNKAEMAIVADDYKTAYSYYKTAFKSVKNPLARDIFNALVCNLLFEDNNEAKKLLIKLAAKGVSIKYLEENTIFGIEKYTAFLEDNKIVYKNVQDLLMKDELDNILEKKAFYETFVQELVKQDSTSNSVIRYYSPSPKKIMEAQKHIIKNGIISEEESFWINNLVNKEENENVETIIHKIAPKFNFNASLDLLYNYTYMGVTAINEDAILLSEIDEKIVAAVKNGILNPVYAIEESTKYRQIYNLFDNEMIQLSISEDSNCVHFNKNIYLKRRIYTSQQIADYDKLMAQFGIESLDDKMKKDLYVYKKNKYFSFPNYLRFELFSVSNCASAESEIKDYELYNEF